MGVIADQGHSENVEVESKTVETVETEEKNSEEDTKTETGI